MSANRTIAQVVAFTLLSSALVMSSLRVARAAPDDVAAKSDAQVQNPANRIVTPSVPVDGTTEGRATATISEQRENARELERRPGEPNPKDPYARANVLGMYLQEGPNGAPRVVEVAAATPAFDAGIHEGDVIVTYQGFTGENYRKWIDGIRKLTSDAPSNSRIPLIISRDGNQMALRIRVPDRVVRADASRVAPQQTPGQVTPTPTAAGASAPGAVAGGNNVLVDGGLPFGDFFGDQTTSTDRATAEIVKLNVAQSNGTGSPAPIGGSTPQTSHGVNPNAATANPRAGMRIGFAGFRDDPSGMVVMVDVGALAPGNYLVGIGDPSVMAGANTGAATGTGVNPNNVNPGRQSQSFLTPPAQSIPPRTNVPNGQPNGGATPPGTRGTTPAPAGARGTQGTLQLIPRTVLAQVASGGGTSGSGNSGTRTGAAATGGTAATSPAGGTRGTAQVKPTQDAPRSQVDPVTGTATAPSGVNNALDNAQGNDNPAVRNTGAGTAGTGTTSMDIGTLTVDQSGTGRLQQTVGGVQVRSVVGQAIIIYSQTGAQSTLPANLNGSSGAANRQGVTDTNSARTSQGVNPTAEPGNIPSNATGTATSGRIPVAAGVIHLISDHRPPSTETGTTSTSTGTVTGGTETATPATGQNRR